MSAHNMKFFDFEVYPHWWCLVVSNEEDIYNAKLYNNTFTAEDEIAIKGKMKIYQADTTLSLETRKEIAELMSTGVLCGYNIKHYDLKILSLVLAGYSPEDIYLGSQLLIRPEKVPYTSQRNKIECALRSFNKCEAIQDLLDDGDIKSLKDRECSLGMDIRETTVPFDKEELSAQEKEEILFYCKHDVFALHVYYVTVSRAYIDTKINLGKSFGISTKTCYNNTNAVLVGKVLGAKKRYDVEIKDPTITIRNKPLEDYFKKYIPVNVYNHLLTSQESLEILMYENDVVIADGGLHSVYHLDKINKKTPALYVKATDEYTMFNVDVSSCYTSVMIYCDAMSRAVNDPKALREIYLRRIKLKMTPKSQWTEDDYAFVAAAKLVLNTCYGAMGNKFLELYDPYMRTKVCRVGQMILIALANCLYTNIPDLKVIQNNTDGVLVYAKRSDYDKIKHYVDEFSEISSFIFEIEEDKELWQINVNNYVAIHPDGEVKNKGNTFITTVYQKGYNRLRPLSNFCIAKAHIDFYVSNATNNPVKTIVNNTNVEDFCMTCTKGPTFHSLVQRNADGTEIDLGKVSRVIAVKDENLGVIKKIGKVTRETKNHKLGEPKENTVPSCPKHPLVVNDALYNYKIENGKLVNIKTNKSWEIDYEYYITELCNVTDISWISMINNNIGLTTKFNI